MKKIVCVIKNVFLGFILGFVLTGCDSPEENQASTQTVREEQQAIAVDVVMARSGTLSETTEYIGTTEPVQTVSLRSQVEGRLLSLNVDVGDRVQTGQILAQLNDTLLSASVNREEGELAALQSDLARAEAQVAAAKTELEKAKVELRQAENDAARYTKLVEEGAISQIEAESYQTAAEVARQELFTAQEQIRIEEEAVIGAMGKIAAQEALIRQEKERQNYANLIAPVTGVVLARLNDPGDLITPGSEVLKLGDFSEIKVIVPVSELDLGTVQIGQTVDVKLDAFANESFVGKVSRISPVADATTRQVEIEVIIPNPNNKIGSGLLARVQFQSVLKPLIIVPKSAVVTERSRSEEDKAVVFVVSEPENGQAEVMSREVILGKSGNNQIEIVAGIEENERFVVNSSQPLNDGDQVKLSILSE